VQAFFHKKEAKKTLISKVTLRSKPPGPQDHRALVPIATQLQNKANIGRRLAEVSQHMRPMAYENVSQE
jgi:hypothetical protein